jgi:NAD(P)-dependent dehydrogenase (short-subunit alcohol dehydrogenase family)
VKVQGMQAVAAGGASGMGRATADLGGLRIAVNTAGGGVSKRTLTKDGPHSLDAFRSVIELNLIATFNLNRLQALLMSGKAGIAGMTLTMARDLGSLGIRVMAIAPSLFATGITAGILANRAATLTRDAAYPRRMGRPEEYAALAVAIVENPMLNGATIRLDGGQRFTPK